MHLFFNGSSFLLKRGPSLLSQYFLFFFLRSIPFRLRKCVLFFFVLHSQGNSSFPASHSLFSNRLILADFHFFFSLFLTFFLPSHRLFFIAPPSRIPPFHLGFFSFLDPLRLYGSPFFSYRASCFFLFMFFIFWFPPLSQLSVFEATKF